MVPKVKYNQSISLLGYPLKQIYSFKGNLKIKEYLGNFKFFAMIYMTI